MLVNGRSLYLHKGGYTPFSVKIPDFCGEVKRIEVICDNSEDLTMIPVSSDFNKNGGLHYPVHLVFLDKIHAALCTEFGLYRMHVRTPEVSSRQAKVIVSTKIENGNDVSKNISVKLAIKDREGKTVAAKKQNISIAGNSSYIFSKRIIMRRPHLWNGMQDPYLYSAEIEISDGGELLDRTRTDFGIRSSRVDKDKGFF